MCSAGFAKIGLIDFMTVNRLGEYLNLLRQIIEEGQELGRFRRDISPGLATDLVFGATDELVTSWLLSEDAGDLARHVDHLTRLFFGGLVPCEYHEGVSG